MCMEGAGLAWPEKIWRTSISPKKSDLMKLAVCGLRPANWVWSRANIRGGSRCLKKKWVLKIVIFRFIHYNKSWHWQTLEFFSWQLTLKPEDWDLPWRGMKAEPVNWKWIKIKMLKRLQNLNSKPNICLNLGAKEAATHPAEYRSLVVQASGSPYSCGDIGWYCQELYQEENLKQQRC